MYNIVELKFVRKLFCTKRMCWIGHRVEEVVAEVGLLDERQLVVGERPLEPIWWNRFGPKITDKI
jgi:hypothetical protein